jgi:hypothetical protein
VGYCCTLFATEAVDEVLLTVAHEANNIKEPRLHIIVLFFMTFHYLGQAGAAALKFLYVAG